MSTTDPLLITDSDMSGVLKNVYTKFRVNSFPIATVLLAQVKKGTPGGPETMQWGGRPAQCQVNALVGQVHHAVAQW